MTVFESYGYLGIFVPRVIRECAKHKSRVSTFRQEPEEHRSGNDHEPVRQGAQIVCPVLREQEKNRNDEENNLGHGGAP